jgi:pimeloyl-ACP methyl ester carboxylesterase
MIVILAIPPTLQAQRSTAHFEPSFRSDRPRVIIMVHGFTANAEISWLANNKAYFPDLLATDNRIALANIFVANYDTHWTEQNSKISDLSAGLWQQLTQVFDVVGRHQDFIFLCASLGGLVVEQMLIDHPELAAKTSLIQFYGTPHQGAWSEFGNPINTIIAALGRSSLIPELRSGSSNQRLVKLDDDWRGKGYNNIARLCAVEAKPYRSIGTGLSGIVVDHFSGSHGCDSNAPLDYINADHVTMVQPKGRVPADEAPRSKGALNVDDVQPYLVFLRNYREHPFYRTTTFDGPERDIKEYLQVDCERTKSDSDYRAAFPLNPANKEQLIGATAHLENTDNIKDATPPNVTLLALGQVSVSYGFNGLDKSLGSCPGGGHATLVIHPTINALAAVRDGW